jgi:hypothetical protein
VWSNLFREVTPPFASIYDGYPPINDPTAICRRIPLGEMRKGQPASLIRSTNSPQVGTIFEIKKQKAWIRFLECQAFLKIHPSLPPNTTTLNSFQKFTKLVFRGPNWRHECLIKSTEMQKALKTLIYIFQLNAVIRNWRVNIWRRRFVKGPLSCSPL